MSKVYVGVGHGGSDPGAVYGTYREAVLALDIANACTAELKRNGVQVMQSRITNETEKLADKIIECNKYAPDYALDIHLNAGGGDGFEVFHTVGGGKGKELAIKIETEVKAIGQNSRGVKTKLNSSGTDYFGFVRQVKCPSILVECAFIDSKDVQIVDTAAERKAMGEAIARGILKQLGVTVKPNVSTSTGSVAKPITTQKTFNVTLPQVSEGSENGFVKVIQAILNADGYKDANKQELATDGDFGAKTTFAVKAFQKDNKLTADGIVGADTAKKLLGV